MAEDKTYYIVRFNTNEDDDKIYKDLKQARLVADELEDLGAVLYKAEHIGGLYIESRL